MLTSKHEDVHILACFVISTLEAKMQAFNFNHSAVVKHLVSS